MLKPKREKKKTVYKKPKPVAKKKREVSTEYTLKVPLKHKGEIVNKLKLTKEGADFFRSKNWI